MPLKHDGNGRLFLVQKISSLLGLRDTMEQVVFNCFFILSTSTQLSDSHDAVQIFVETAVTSEDLCGLMMHVVSL